MIDHESHDIFVPDTVLPSQDFAPRDALPEAERSLMVAVLEDAVRCLLNHCRATDNEKRGLYRTAVQWFRAVDHTGLYTFENVCEVLGLEASYVRRRLLDERDRRRASAAPSVAPASPATSLDDAKFAARSNRR